MDKMLLKFSAKSENEAFARTCVAAFIIPLNPTIEFIDDVKTAVSEAVTNAVVHAYPSNEEGLVQIECEIDNSQLHIKIIDFGKGIENVSEAIEPFYTTRADEERSGMGFTVMKTFMDELSVKSNCGEGTVVSMSKRFVS